MTRTVLSRAALLLFLTAAACALLTGTASASQWAATEQRLVDRINADRRAAGLGVLRADAELQRVARDWTGVMAREDRLYHNPGLASQVSREWRHLAENIGWEHHPGTTAATQADRLHARFMGSAAHRVNILRPGSDRVGVGARVTPEGKLWVTVIFMQSTEQPPGAAPGGFRDVRGGPHADAIEAISLRRITRGCAPELFCPNRQVTRGQMASFLTRALDLPAAPRSRFTDTSGSPHRADIDSLAAAGITTGCTPSRFCPDAPVSRAQMASFLVKAFGVPPSDRRYFIDVGQSVHRSAINALAENRTTFGCGGGRYCPNNPVTRAQTASFLARALNLV